MNKMINDIISKNLEGEKITAFDIGAKGGVLNLKKIKDHLTYFGFEPNQKEFNKLVQSNEVTYFPFALGGTNGKENFHITKHSSYSSFLQLDQQNFEKHFGLMKDYKIWKEGMEIEKTISINVHTLDHVLSDMNMNRIDFLKLDTQGTELEIMKGAKNSLTNHKIGVIFAEFNFLKIYKNQNSFSELDIYLNQLGYECIDCRFYPNSVKQLNLSNKIYDYPRYSSGGDAVFIPKLEHSDLAQKDIFKIGLIVAQLGYLSVAKKLFKQCQLNENEIQVLFKYMHTFSLKKIGIELVPPFIYKLIKTIIK